MLFDLWLRSAQEMRLLAEARGAGFLHVVQPNQYYSKHSFSQRERAVALSLPPEHEYRRGVEMGYALLAARSATRGRTASCPQLTCSMLRPTKSIPTTAATTRPPARPCSSGSSPPRSRNA
jgi:hypothetical protein